VRILLLACFALAGCAVRPCVCRCRVAPSPPPQVSNVYLHRVQGLAQRMEDRKRFEGQVSLEQAAKAAASVADAEREAREGQAAFDLNELQDELERKVRP
jgi:hypothetical protein